LKTRGERVLRIKSRGSQEKGENYQFGTRKGGEEKDRNFFMTGTLKGGRGNPATVLEERKGERNRKSPSHLTDAKVKSGRREKGGGRECITRNQIAEGKGRGRSLTLRLVGGVLGGREKKKKKVSSYSTKGKRKGKGWEDITVSIYKEGCQGEKKLILTSDLWTKGGEWPHGLWWGFREKHLQFGKRSRYKKVLNNYLKKGKGGGKETVVS